VVVTPHEFSLTLSEQVPPRALSAPLAALWWAKKGDWDKAHKLAQDDASQDATWVHAYLHRCEDDLGNARYWYAQAHKPAASGDLDAEWSAIVAALLTQAA
jgi:hypothetical protein